MARSKTTFETGNSARETHGAAAGEKALSSGVEFSGLAALAEREITAELETHGITAIVKRDAIRLQTVADLYYAAILGADTLEKLDSLVKRYGWIQASALRAWAQVREEEREAASRGLSADQVLDAIRAAGKSENDNESKDSEV